MSAERHTGSCQCGAVAFEAMVDIEEPAVCNCSRCQRVGSVLAFTAAADFTLLRGEEALTDYTFNRGVIHHKFCKVCGIQTFSFGNFKGKDMVAINCNCLDDGVDPRALKVRQVDGRSF